ncbi:hypothetical protein [Microbacterium sp. SORGH_AS_0862]|uniref:hypothetical protein n=1 Tax=Microbacterium sp. SORGH_AS_0862 TaxID=3041789 RepID=UPI00278EE334|nr:hypothetical protein [Microbacterium sp. SORGH_AS_0862]MDQ1206212.1 cytoskeletal protein CcmA (bactofilin family) [Microbacterium sp. SORGH_AS_0862]
MTRINNLNAPNFSGLRDSVATMETHTPLGHSSIHRGGIRVASAEGLLVQGSQRVSGTLIVSGEEYVEGVLNISGVLVVSGSTSITGPTQITGPFQVDGATVISGTTTISGDVSLESDLIITASGAIRLGEVEIASGVGGSGGMSAPNKITMQTPLVDVQGGLNVEQGAVFRGNVTTPNLPTITESASGLPRNTIYVQPTTRQHYRVVPG